MYYCKSKSNGEDAVGVLFSLSALFVSKHKCDNSARAETESVFLSRGGKSLYTLGLST